VETSVLPRYVRQRVVFYARPRDAAALPKSLPDFESAGAAWVAPGEIGRLPLRGPEPSQWAEYLAGGGDVYPLTVLSREGADEPPRRG